MQEEMKNILDRLDALELENKRLHAIQDVTNVISKMAYFQECGAFEDRYHMLASKTPGVSVEIGARGVFEGYEHCYYTMVVHEENFVKAHAEGVRKAYPDREFETEHTGMLESSVIGTPVIEVAEDGETVRGQWMAMMIMAKSRGEVPESGFVWWKIAADFVQEDGQWKVWHLRMDPMTTGPFGDFAALSIHMPEPMKPNTEWKNQHVAGSDATWPHPDKPVTEMYYTYRPWTTAANYPTPPEPYRTFSEVKDW